MNNNTNEGNWHKLNDRINHVENQVASIGTKVESMQDDITGLVDAFNNYVDNSNKFRETNWGNVAAWVAVAISCISALLYHHSLVMEPVRLTNEFQQKELDRQQGEIKELKNGTINPSL
jgi:hypothetical protein